MRFYKYQGTGNDFIVLDGRNGVPENLPVRLLCERRFGIGADGLMYLQSHPDFDFEMVYFNSDGNISSMCGNGGRCLAHFADSLGIGNQGEITFLAVDGPHKAIVKGNMVSLGMQNVREWEKHDTDIWTMNTGSPHFVRFVNEDVNLIDLIPYAKSVRYSNEYSEHGINVNIVRKLAEDAIEMRTYERGVEDETLSCGTGVTAAAILLQLVEDREIPVVKINTPGGTLEVLSERRENGFVNVVLRGPAVHVYTGEID